MGYFEFPHTRTYDSDLGWLITEYKRLAEEVAALAVRMTDAEADIDQLQEDVLALQNEMVTFKQEVRQMFADLEADLRERFEELSENIDAQLAEMEARLTVRIDALEATVNETLEAFRTELTETEEEMRQELADAIAEMNETLQRGLSELRTEVAEFKNSVENTLGLYDLKIDENLETAKEYTDEREAYLQYQIDNIRIDPTTRVITPATQEESTVQDAFDTEHYYLRAWGLRARYYDNNAPTASEYDAEQLRAYDYDYLGKWFLIEKKQVALVYSPFNGAIETLQAVVNEISDRFREFIGSSLTATEYDALEKTATEYDELEILAFNYDYYSKLIFE